MYNINWIAILSTIVLIATIVTIIFAFSAYFISMRMRQKKAASRADALKQQAPRDDQHDKTPKEIRILKPYNPFESSDSGSSGAAKGKTWK
ncbi:MAG: hypothetical protein WCS77_04660 [Elusimicrobiaceae bacterium]|jgi:hypothetical protein